MVVPDLDRAMAWYRDELGFEVEARWDVEDAALRFAHLRADGVLFELMERDGVDPRPEEPWDPTQIPGGLVPGRVDRPVEPGSTAKVRLDGPVAEVVEVPREDGPGRVHVMRDADGRRIEVVEPPEE